MKTETAKTRLPELLKRHQAAILKDWTQSQLDSAGAHSGRLSEAEVREQSRALLNAFMEGSQQGAADDLSGAAWTGLRSVLEETAKSRAHAGFSPADTARFVFSLKEALFAMMRREWAED